MNPLRSCLLAALALPLTALVHAAAVTSTNTPPTSLPPRTLRVGAMVRHYVVYAPPLLRPGSALLIALHPSGASGQGMRRICGDLLERLARDHGFVVAYPDGFEGHFDDLRRKASYSARRLKIDDVGFIRAIVKNLGQELAIDPSRVYALGYSNGGAMALRLALETPDLVAGVISISANLPTMDNIDCPIIEGRHTSVVLIEGTADPINPYLGGRVSIFGLGDRGPVLSAQKSAEWFARRYGIELDRQRQPALEAGGLTASWQDWGSNTPLVRLITIQGGGHSVPKAPRPGSKIFLTRTFRSDALIEAAVEMMPGAAKGHWVDLTGEAPSAAHSSPLAAPLGGVAALAN